MVGSSIQATRGNDSARMIERALSALEEGRTFRIIGVEDLPDDWMAVVTCGVGGGQPWEYVEERVEAQDIKRIGFAQLEAVKALSRYLKKDFNALIRSEPAGATLTA